MHRNGLELDSRMDQAVAEMKALVRTRFPTATFRLDRSDEDPTLVHLTAIVDIDDPDEVTDLVIDRMRELLVEEGLPLVVIPIPSPDRVAAMLEATRPDAARA